MARFLELKLEFVNASLNLLYNVDREIAC